MSLAHISGVKAVATSASSLAVLTVPNGTNYLYIASIGSKSGTPLVTGVTDNGPGLTWTAIDTQCGSRNQTRVTAYWAYGSYATGTFTVTFTLDGSANLAGTVEAFTGSDPTDPIGDFSAWNTNAENGSCGGGTDGSTIPTSGTHSITTEQDNSFILVMLNSRDDDWASLDADYTQMQNCQTAVGGGSDASCRGARRSTTTAGAYADSHTIADTSDWCILVFEIMEPAFTLEQEGFRFRDDDDNEASATWRQSQDVNDSIARNTNFRLRYLLNGTGNPPSDGYTIQYKENADAAAEWRDVPLT